MAILTGIYKIECLKNNKLYIGSSKNIYSREKEHFSTLNKNKHYNKHLQNAYNKYGKEGFLFEIIEECSVEDLLNREIYYVATSEKELFNINTVIRTRLSYPRTDKHREESRIKGLKYQKIAAQSRVGLKHSLETKIKISRARGCNLIEMYSKDNVLEKIFNNTSEICELMNIKSSNLRNNLYGITKTCCGKIFKYANK